MQGYGQKRFFEGKMNESLFPGHKNIDINIKFLPQGILDKCTKDSHTHATKNKVLIKSSKNTTFLVYLSVKVTIFIQSTNS